MNDFLPIYKKEMTARGWDEVDFVYVSGDAYVDHPSFGASIITRVLDAKGYKVAFLAQPSCNNTNDFIGNDEKCLIRPANARENASNDKNSTFRKKTTSSKFNKKRPRQKKR